MAECCKKYRLYQKILRTKIVQTYWTYSSISSRIGARGLQRLSLVKYYNVLEWESRFTLGLNAAKNTDYFKKFFKKLFRIKYHTENSVKNSLDAYLISLKSGARRLQRLPFLNIIMYWNRKVDLF